MRKIFYRPENLEIMGMSNGENSMPKFPSIDIEENYHSTNGMKIVRDGDGVKLIIENIYPENV